MIEVNGKTLEVGDKVRFRNGGEAKVKTTAVFSPTSYSVLYEIDNNEDIVVNNYAKGGYLSTCGKSEMLDIVDIIKAEKPEIEERYTVVYSWGCSHDAYKELIEAKDNSSSNRLGILKIKIDKTNNKILSVDIVND